MGKPIRRQHALGHHQRAARAGLGDTAYFISLRHLGHRRSLLMMLLAPIFAGLIALFGGTGHSLAGADSWKACATLAAG